jgi:hypothetical protein
MVLGLVLNPYFPNNILMLYTQIFKVNLIANLYNVEWKPWPFFEFIKNNILVLFYVLISIFILIKNKKITKVQFFYLSLTLFFFVYTLISRRMQEYLVPFSILAFAFLYNEFSNKLDKNNFKYHENQRFSGHKEMQGISCAKNSKGIFTHKKFSIFACIKIISIIFLIILGVVNFILLSRPIL